MAVLQKEFIRRRMIIENLQKKGQNEKRDFQTGSYYFPDDVISGRTKKKEFQARSDDFPGRRHFR